MNYLKVENFLLNLSFFLLFASMLYYWIQIAFFSNIFKSELERSSAGASLQLDSRTSVAYSKPSNIQDTSMLSKSQPLASCAAKDAIIEKQELDVTMFQTNQQALIYPTFFSQSGDLNPVQTELCSSLIEKKSHKLNYGQVLLLLANLTMLILLSERWLESGHFPLSNLYESLIFLSWSLTCINLWIEKPQTTLNFWSENISNLTPPIPWIEKLNFKKDNWSEAPAELRSSKNNLKTAGEDVFSQDNLEDSVLLIPRKRYFASSKRITEPIDGVSQNETLINGQRTNSTNTQRFNLTKTNKKQKLDFIFGGIIIPIALIVHAFASFSLPPELRESTSLVPALQSNWLIMHVTVIMLSYAALLAGCLFSFVFLFFDFFLSGIITPAKEKTNNTKQSSNTDIKNLLDDLSYRTIGIGFLLLTIGIFSGAVWANEAWGSYWSWDPKETWALITWFIFATYLHVRLQFNWPKKKAAMIACSGFIVVWVCYLGVNLLGQGLHSYGFLTT